MFIDEAKLIARGGKGGNGCCAFRREKYVARGGPYGGDGGRGGSVYLKANVNLTTLMDIPTRTIYQAHDGKPGLGKKMTGANAEDLYVEVPPGTIIRDAETNMMLADLVEPGDCVCVAKGGRGGHGNAHYSTSTNRTPRTCEKGFPGEQRHLALELKLIADVGLVGLPNAGKSTLLSRVSDAHPKIADYPFTTLEPQLGIADAGDGRRVVIADLPGLIEGAHSGHGLGDEFLRHIERTRVVCHLVDMAPISGPEPAAAYRMIRKELKLYSEELATKPHLVVANKMDLTEAKANLTKFKRSIRGARVFPISAVAGMGLKELIYALREELDKCS